MSRNEVLGLSSCTVKSKISQIVLNLCIYICLLFTYNYRVVNAVCCTLWQTLLICGMQSSCATWWVALCVCLLHVRLRLRDTRTTGYNEEWLSFVTWGGTRKEIRRRTRKLDSVIVEPHELGRHAELLCKDVISLPKSLCFWCSCKLSYDLTIINLGDRPFKYEVAFMQLKGGG